MFFSESFIEEVEESPVTGITEVCKMTFSELDRLSDSSEWNESEHELLWEAASFVNTVLTEKGLDVPAKFPQATGNIQSNCARTHEYLHAIEKYF